MGHHWPRYRHYFILRDNARDQLAQFFHYFHVLSASAALRRAPLFSPPFMSYYHDAASSVRHFPRAMMLLPPACRPGTMPARRRVRGWPMLRAR